MSVVASQHGAGARSQSQPWGVTAARQACGFRRKKPRVCRLGEIRRHFGVREVNDDDIGFLVLAANVVGVKCLAGLYLAARAGFGWGRVPTLFPLFDPGSAALRRCPVPVYLFPFLPGLRRALPAAGLGRRDPDRPGPEKWADGEVSKVRLARPSQQTGGPADVQ